MNVYVVGTLTDGSGGFEWNVHKDAAEQTANSLLRVAYMCHASNERFDVSGVREVEIPPEIAERYEQVMADITSWLDHDPDLWEPNGTDFPTVTFGGGGA